MDVSALKKLPVKYILIILLISSILSFAVIKLLSSNTPQQPPFSKSFSSFTPPSSTETPSFPLPSSKTTPANNYKSKEKGDPEFAEKLDKSLIKQFPLLKSIPYETSEFKIVYSNPLELTVELKTQTSTQSAETKVLNWIQLKGVSPSTHKIIFK